ncbi:PREDICTED: oral-facial-digital syndrome 1 protein homolog [Branchiostoma belcheri]|uniref:Oral-facial-digital syndrome 1 protein homolog n=1 Tax=Branchiostoma belcheri TaxID=7741 RepID=A0A6P4Y7P9_BRABE|nr:PREDICTED: oral-facial-digital syndrome 1 protein homolog [Branchiostoma belcheri]
MSPKSMLTLKEFKSEAFVWLEKQLQEERERLQRPPADLLVLQAELQRERDRLGQEKAVYEHQKQQLKNDLDSEVSRYTDLRRRHDEQTRLLKQTEREVADLRLALQQTQIALQNEIYRNPKPSVINSHRSSTPSSDDDLLRPANSDLYMDTSLRKTRVDPALQLVGGYHSNRMSGRPDRSLGFIEETKQRFLELEREAENLEKTYQTYQQRMGNIPSLPRDPAQGIIGRHHVSPPRPTHHSSTPRAVHHVSWAEPPQTRPAAAAELGESYTSTIHSPIRGSDDHPRPLSSTPYRQDGRLHGNASLGLSEVTTWSPEEPARTQRRRDSDQPRESVRAPADPMTVDDLIARPGEPSVVVLPGSETDSERSASPPLHESTVLGADRRAAESDQPQDSRHVPSPRRQDTAPEVRQPERWSTLEMAPSQDDMTGADRRSQEDRRRQEERDRQDQEDREQREWEETLRKREERRRQEEEERDRQRRELERLQKMEAT